MLRGTRGMLGGPMLGARGRWAMLAFAGGRTFGGGRARKAPVIFRFWKPAGVVSAMSASVDGVDILTHNPELRSMLSRASGGRPVQTIGRLDKASEGLLLLTPELPLINRLLHPSRSRSGGGGSPVEKGPFRARHAAIPAPPQNRTASALDRTGTLIGTPRACPAEYHVRTARRVSWRIIERLRRGVEISSPRAPARARAGAGGSGYGSGVGAGGRKTLPCLVERLVEGDQKARLRIVLREGKNRQIRKMLGGQGHAVLGLKRVGFGPIGLDGLSPGQAECLAPAEVEALLGAAGAGGGT